MRKQKHVEDSRTENTYLIMPKHINGYGRLFGGILLQWIDEVAGIVAHRHAGSIVTTACVDNLNFKAGARLPVFLQSRYRKAAFLPAYPVSHKTIEALFREQQPQLQPPGL